MGVGHDPAARRSRLRDRISHAQTRQHLACPALRCAWARVRCRLRWRLGSASALRLHPGQPAVRRGLEQDEAGLRGRWRVATGDRALRFAAVLRRRRFGGVGDPPMDHRERPARRHRRPARPAALQHRHLHVRVDPDKSKAPSVITRKGLPFKANEHFGKAEQKERRALVLDVASKIWSPLKLEVLR